MTETNPAIFVFARYDSARLPGKALLDICGRPLLGRVLDRVRRTPGAYRTIVATSDRPVDDRIAAFAAGEGVEVFRGSGHDVLGRALACAEQLKLSHIARISGDSPFIDPNLIAKCLERAVAGKADIVTNVFPRTWPPGVSVEVMSRETLQRVSVLTGDLEDREHVTRYIYNHSNAFRIDNIAAEDPRYSSIRLTVDTQEELDRAREIIAGLGPDAGLNEIVSLVNSAMPRG